MCHAKTKKGFVVSMDAIIALLISLFFVSYTYSIVNSFSDYDSISYVKLQRMGEDALNVMEATNAFGSQSLANSVFQQTGDQICMRLEVYNQSFDPLQKKNTFLKQGCTHKKGIQGEEQVFRTFYSGGNFYYAVISVWLKEN